MTSEELFIAVREGHKAHRAGYSKYACPYESPAEYHAWLAGWVDADRGFDYKAPKRIQDLEEDNTRMPLPAFKTPTARTYA